MPSSLPVIRFGTLAVSHLRPERLVHEVPLLFVHGAWCGKYQFENWIRFAAEQGWESYALDLRGHGESACEDFGNATIEDYAKDIETVVSEIGTSYVVGHSLGGLALQLAASRSSLIRKAVLLASAPPAGIVAHYGFTGRVMSYFVEFFSRKPTPLKRSDVFRFLYSDPVAAQEFDFNALESPRAVRDIGLWRIWVKRLPCPSLVVAGEEDHATPLRAQREIAKKYNSDYVQIPHIGHMLMLEKGWEKPIYEILRWLGEEEHDAINKGVRP